MTRADYCVVLFAALLLPYLYITQWTGNESGITASIMSGSSTTQLSLAHDHTVEVAGTLGTSVIKIEGGKIRFVTAPCLGKQCIHSGWLQHAGEFAACLPNRISIAVLGETPRFDSINF
ncbi:MAG TPA: NusG domain II-containing protein [Chromatiales bacterium]|nr:NusG domain II-containing protein [Chromatiales bacterium]